MKEFYADIREKKTVAASARHRKCGSKTKHVSLPSDGMTPAEWKRRNGAVATYNLKQPTTWAGLKAMPSDLQKKYLEGLREDYNANTLVISQMLGIGAQALRTLAASLGVTFPRGGGGRMSDLDQARWRSFLLGNVAPAFETEEVQETTPEPEQEPAPKPGPAPERTGVVLTRGRMSFHGPAEDVLQQMQIILGDQCGQLEITWDFDKEE